MLPNTIWTTLTAVPRSSGMPLVAAVGDRPRRVPGAEHGRHGPVELLRRILGEVLAGPAPVDAAEPLQQPAQVVGVEIDVRSARPGRPCPVKRRPRRGARRPPSPRRRTSARTGGRSRARTARSGSASRAPPPSRSFRPRFRIVSIMPGIDTGAPERTDTSRGSDGSPSLRPTRCSSAVRRSRPGRASRPARCRRRAGTRDTPRW